MEKVEAVGSESATLDDLSLYIKGGNIVDRLDWVILVPTVVSFVANLARIMPSHKRLDDNVECLGGLPPKTKVEAFAKKTTHRYYQMVDLNIKQVVKEIENSTRQEFEATRPIAEQEAGDFWLRDPSNTRSCQTQFYKNLEVYWITKFFVAQALKRKEDDDKGIQTQLTELKALVQFTLTWIGELAKAQQSTSVMQKDATPPRPHASTHWFILVSKLF